MQILLNGNKFSVFSLINVYLFVILHPKKYRDIAQLVARHVRDVEAGRSSRPISTRGEIKQLVSLCLWIDIFAKFLIYDLPKVYSFDPLLNKLHRKRIKLNHIKNGSPVKSCYVRKNFIG